jgi:hypothetical protein
MKPAFWSMGFPNRRLKRKIQPYSGSSAEDMVFPNSDRKMKKQFIDLRHYKYGMIWK